MTAVMIATYFFKLDLKFEYDNLNNSSCTPMCKILYLRIPLLQ